MPSRRTPPRRSPYHLAMRITKQGRAPRTMPFDMSGVMRTDDGVLRYSGLAPSLLAMFDTSVQRHPDNECIVVVGGERATYQELWDRSARVAGGLRAARRAPGDRVANRHANGLEWCLGFWGTLMAGAVVVPVNTRFADSRGRLRRQRLRREGYVFGPDARAARR